MRNVIYATGLVADADKNYPIVGYDNVVVAANLSSTTAATGYPVSNLANPSTNLVWKGVDGGGDEYVTVQIPGGEVDYLAIARHNMFTVGATLSLEYESAPSTWVALTQPFVPANNRPLIVRFVRGAYSAIRLRIQSATADPSIAVLYIGSILTLERKVYVGHTPAPLARRPNAVNAMSESGNFLGRIILSETNGSQVSMTNLTAAWVRAKLDPFFLAAQEEPFFFAWRPHDYPGDVNFAWMSDMTPPANQSPNGMMSASFSFTAIKE